MENSMKGSEEEKGNIILVRVLYLLENGKMV